MLVVGVGGGVSTAGLVLGVASGATVYATSRDAAKRAGAIALGAADAFDSNETWPVQADVVFENVGAATWDNSIRALKPGGRLVTCGGTAGSKVEISLPRLFFKQHEIIGSTMGSYAEFDEPSSASWRPGFPSPSTRSSTGSTPSPRPWNASKRAIRTERS